MHDSILIEQRGTPATVVITEPFQPVVATNAAKLGMAGYHYLTVPHPVWGKDDDAFNQLASNIAGAALTQLTIDD